MQQYGLNLLKVWERLLHGRRLQGHDEVMMVGCRIKETSH
jgi:hypothetical protein